VPRSDSGQTSMDQPSSSSRHRNKGGSGSSHNRKFNTNGQGNQFIPSRNMSQGNNRPSVNGQRQSSFVSSEPNASNPYFKDRSEEHTSELQSRFDLVCRLLLEKKKMKSSRLLAK